MDKNKIVDKLELFKPTMKEKYVEIVLPVAIKIYNDCLTLRIIPYKDGFIVSDDAKTFSEFNESTNYYYDLFMQDNKNNHYDIKLYNNLIYKQYPDNFNLTFAINEFIRFFIDLDNFIKNNNLT